MTSLFSTFQHQNNSRNNINIFWFVLMKLNDKAKLLHWRSSKSRAFCIRTSVLGASKGWPGMFSHLHRISDKNSVVTITSWSRLVQVFLIAQFKTVGRAGCSKPFVKASFFFDHFHIWPLPWPPQVFPNQVPLIKLTRDGLVILEVVFTTSTLAIFSFVPFL